MKHVNNACAERGTRALLTLLLLAASALAPAVRAEPVLLDRIAAIVDDDVVMDSDIERRMADIRAQIASRGARMPPEDVLRKQVLDRLILESIQVQMATRMGARIDDETLSGNIEGIARQNGMGLRDFVARLASEGVDYEAFRDEVRRDMLMKTLRQRRVGDRVRVTDADVDEFLRSSTGRDLFAGSFHIAHILVAVPEGADVPAVQAASTKVEALLKDARAGADFADLAVRNSDAANALEGGDLGWRTGAQLPSLFANVVHDMKPGDVAGPLRSASGFHIVKLIERKAGEERVVQQAKVRHVLVKPSTLRDRAEARTVAEGLLARVRAGEDFAAIAKKHSDDPGSALAGGDLGWVSPGQMVDPFEAAMNATAVGAVSDIFESEFGWHFLQVIERRSQDTSEELRRTQARNAVWKRKFDSEMETWLRELRNEAYVDIKAAP